MYRDIFCNFQFVSGLSQLEIRKDPFVARTLRDILIYYLPRFTQVWIRLIFDYDVGLLPDIFYCIFLAREFKSHHVDSSINCKLDSIVTHCFNSSKTFLILTTPYLKGVFERCYWSQPWSKCERVACVHRGSCSQSLFNSPTVEGRINTTLHDGTAF